MDRSAVVLKKHEKHQKHQRGGVLHFGQIRCRAEKAPKAPKAPAGWGPSLWTAPLSCPLYSLFCSLLCGAFGCFLSACKPKNFSDFVLFGAFQRLHFPSPCKNGYYVHYYVVLFGAFSRLDITTLKRLLSSCFSTTSFPITLQNRLSCSLLCCAFWCFFST